VLKESVESLPADAAIADRVLLLALYLETCILLARKDLLRERVPELEALVARLDESHSEERLHALRVLRKAYCEQGRYELAVRGNAAAKRGLAGEETKEQISVSLPEIDALVRLGEASHAERKAIRLLASARRNRDPRLEGNACGVLANVAKGRGRLKEALRLIDRAIEMHRRSLDPVSNAADYLNKGCILNRLGALYESKESFGEAFRRAMEIGAERLVLKSRIGLGIVALREGRWAEARRLFLGTWREARRKGMVREEALSLEFLSELYALLGQLEKAHSALSSCLRLAGRVAPGGDISVEGKLRKAIVELASDRLQQALMSVQEAASQAMSAGLPWEEAQAARLRGVILARMGRRAEALRSFRRAVGLFDQMGERLEIQAARLWVTYLTGELSRVAVPREEQPWLWHSLWSPPSEVGPGSGAMVRGAGQSRQRRPRVAREPSETWQRLGLVTRNETLMRTLLEAEDVARLGRPILILGESGTGKELLARGIHELSGRRGAFVPFNCAACPPDLIESELFGVERGAYTGAVTAREGLIRKARGGTLFLDEVGDLGDRAQGALLRFLDSGELRALGSSRVVRVSLGVVSATHRALSELVGAGKFRQDLFFRLCAVTLELPPLRKRLEDLDLLLKVLWKRVAKGRPVPRWLVSDKTLASLRGVEWPGNVRQLGHFVSRLALTRRVEDPIALVRKVLREQVDGALTAASPTRNDILAALVEARGIRKKAAEILGISRPRLYRLMQKYGIDG
jgi:two-component system NtrC family response regulator